MDDKDQIKSESESEPPISPDIIPNGGLQAWIQVLGAHFIFFNSWGISNTFGDYQLYYETNILSAMSASSISWIGTVQGFLLVGFGGLAGPLYDKGYFRLLLVLGTFLVVFGMMMTSVATQYYEIFLAQGICTGLGMGMNFVPGVSSISAYFSTKRATAMGIAAAGGGLGGVIYPIIFRQLIDKIGFGWTTRIIAFIALATLAPTVVVMKRRVGSNSVSPKYLDMSMFSDGSFMCFSAGLFLAFIGNYIPSFYIPRFDQGKLHASQDFSLYLLSIYNAASIFGRVLPNLLADRFTPLSVLIPCPFIAAILAFGWIGIDSTASLIVFCVLYGFVSGTMISLPPSVVATALCDDLQVIGSRMGMSCAFASLGFLIGNPIAGALEGSGSTPTFVNAQAFCGAVLCGSGMLFIVVLWIKQGGEKALLRRCFIC